ncbi:hypothetical protein HK104_003067 [Borealophlyctis nickersoniae]|nr:hypothetical protein HK104_003067 [Borealophlyctis nickersoniae]
MAVEDGQHIYLDKLDYKMLAWNADKKDGKHNLPPDVVEVPLIKLVPREVDQSFRSRARHLSHLPLRTPIYICHTDLSSVVSPETRTKFCEEVDKIRARRKAAEAAAAKAVAVKDTEDAVNAVEDAMRRVDVSGGGPLTAVKGGDGDRVEEPDKDFPPLVPGGSAPPPRVHFNAPALRPKLQTGAKLRDMEKDFPPLGETKVEGRGGPSARVVVVKGRGRRR